MNSEKKSKLKVFFNKKNIKNLLLDTLIYIVGCFIYAAAINMFTAPNAIAPGGVTGIAIILNYLFGLPIGTMMLVMNIPLFLLAWKYLGRHLIFKTGIVLIILSIIVDLTEPYFPTYTGDTLLACLFGGLLLGAAMAIIFIRGATTGGSDILAKLMRLKWPHISMGRVILITDLVVVAVAAIVFNSIESSLYALIAIFVNTKVIDYILYGTGNGKSLMVVTEKAKEIALSITSDMGRGVTILPVQGGYTGKDKNMLICAVRRNEVARLNKIIHSHDSNAFIIITEAGEILGEGFSKGSF